VPARLGFACQGTFPTKNGAPDRDLDLVWRTSRSAWALRPPIRVPALH
jgi:hypothetical protein